MAKHVVLGAGGVIANATIEALVDEGLKPLGLTQKQVDVLETDKLIEALSDASHVYMPLGLPYNGELWRNMFPKLMSSVLEACEQTATKLIYFDNCYMYGPAPLQNPILETHTQEPSSVKGKARKTAVDLALKAHTEGRVEVAIGRSADFYGPGAINSPYYIKFLTNMFLGHAPQTAMKQGPVHTYAYTADCGRAMARLGTDDRSFGEVWHLPVGPAVTVDEMTEHFNAALGSAFMVSYMPASLLETMAETMPFLKEVQEMNYQFDTDYVLSDDKFRALFPDFEVTSYEEGARAMVEFFKG